MTHETERTRRKLAGTSGNWETEMDRLSECGAIAWSKEPRTCRADVAPPPRTRCRPTGAASALLSGERPVMHGDGLNGSDYVHVSGVAEAYPRALCGDGDGVFNIGTGRSRTLREVCAAAARAAGHGGDPVHTGARPGEQRRSSLGVRRARRVRGRQAVVAFDLGVAQTVASLRAGTDTPAPGCAGPARVPRAAAGPLSKTGWRQ